MCKQVNKQKDLNDMREDLKHESDTHDLEKVTADEHKEFNDLSFIDDNTLNKKYNIPLRQETPYEVKEVKKDSKNNGGVTDYYSLKDFNCGMDLIEDRDMNYSQGNIVKVALTFNIGRHDGTNYERDLNKIIFFANRELERIKGSDHE